MTNGRTPTGANVRAVTFAPDASELIGYRVCACGDYVPELEFMQLSHQCWKCYETSDVRRARTLLVLHAGQVAELRIPPRRRRGSRGSKGNRTTRQIRKYAERAALMRLKEMFPDAYRLLYTEERIARGLPVVPARGTTQEPPDAYHAGLNRGDH